MRFNLKCYIFLLSLAVCISTLAQENFSRENRSGERPGMENGQSDNSKKDKNQIDTLRIRAYLLDMTLGEKNSVDFDTTSLNFQNFTFPERKSTISAEHLANLGSPFQSRIFNDRTEKSPFIFLRSWEQWYKSPDEFVFLNTTKPYTNLKYLTTFGNEKSQEENFQFYYSANVNKYLNIGADYEIIYSRGFYTNNSTRDKLADIFGNYQSPKYEAFWKASYNYMENLENGGITDDRYITDPLLMSGGLKEYESLNIPVNLTDAKNQHKNHQLYFNQRYNLGFERVDVKDTLKREFVPVTSLIHTLYIDQSQKSYRSSTANPVYYDSIANIDSKLTADTCSLFVMRNTFGISLREGFHEWAKMGLTGFIEHEFKRYMEYSPDARLRDSTNLFSRYSYHNQNLLWAGGELYRREGKTLNYSALAKICLQGEQIGDFELNGNIKTDFSLLKHTVKLDANGYIKNIEPDYFLEHYYSNHFSWDNSFYKEKRVKVDGSLEIPDLGFGFSASAENLTDYVYFNNKALPQQFSGNIQVLSANLRQHLCAGVFNWDNDIVYQHSSNENVLALPDFTIYSNFYIKTFISKVLLTHIGVDCRYFTEYYAPAYMPATGQFYTQKDVKIGNYPFMNAYANFNLKRMRFFVMYSHVSRLFADPKYFSGPHYPMNSSIIKAGLSWNFWD